MHCSSCYTFVDAIENRLNKGHQEAYENQPQDKGIMHVDIWMQWTMSLLRNDYIFRLTELQLTSHL